MSGPRPTNPREVIFRFNEECEFYHIRDIARRVFRGTQPTCEVEDEGRTVILYMTRAPHETSMIEDMAEALLDESGFGGSYVID